jgi:drug/metabolite transporter (DMT)-like permease
VATPFVRGIALALLAALAFGATTPLVQRFGAGVSPFATAALLYAGAAMASVRPRRAAAREAPLRARHAPRVALVAIAGAVVAPACLAWGLQRTSAITASLLLNLEALFTALLARALFREPIGARVAAALTAIGAAGAVLVVFGADAERPARAVSAALGALAIAGATLAWAVDNALTRPLADLDPSHVVAAKGALGACVSGALAYALGSPRPDLGSALGLVLCGATGYGASLRLYLAAQRAIGAARTASAFATAPFVGALVAMALGARAPAVPVAIAAALCAFGAWLHLGERHAHAHTHEATEHEHAHRHDDGHHTHAHEPPVAGVHSHVHRHEAVTHDHEHAPDVHHGHGHE